MDLAAGARQVWVLMEHQTKSGESRLVRRCTYPLTALGAVKRIYTNLAVLGVTEQGFAVREMAPGMTFEVLQKNTDAPLHPQRTKENPNENCDHGAGSVGGTLGRRWAELGHSVCFGVRDVANADAKALIGRIKGDARLASVGDAARDADVVVLATPYQANSAAIAEAGNLSGKILIDVTNPVGADLTLAVGFNTSDAEQVAKLAPRARGSTRR